MSNELMKSNSNMITQGFYDLDRTERLALHLAKSGFFETGDKKKSVEEKASEFVVKVIAGEALGIDPVSSVTNLDVINGKVRLEAHLMSGLIERSAKYDYTVDSHDEKSCTVSVFRNGEKRGTETFTIDEAKQAGLLNKDNWKKYPYDMLYARALSRLFRKYCSELALGGVYTTDELEPEQVTVIEPNVIEANIQPALPDNVSAIGDVAKEQWLKAIIKHADYPKEGTPLEKMYFVHAQIEERDLEFTVNASEIAAVEK